MEGASLHQECDINPLIASEDSIMSLDARVLLHDPSVDAVDLPQPSIRPYPHQRLGLKLGRLSISFSKDPTDPESQVVSFGVPFL